MLILADDMRRDFQATLRTLFDGSWVEVTNATAQVLPRGPSRIARLHRKYASRTGVLANGDTDLLDDNDTIATRLKAAGYHTGLFGKYLNYYPWGPNDFVPPGWDEWKGHSGEQQAAVPHLHRRDVRPGDGLRQPCTDRQAVLPYVATRAPHTPALPPQRYVNTAVNPPQPGPGLERARRGGQGLVRAHHASAVRVLKLAEFTSVRAHVVRCLMGIDDGIRNLVQTLHTTGRLQKTVLIFTSDNGYLFGEHRLIEKGHPYEEAVHMPFHVRWPGVPGRTDAAVVSSVDIPAAICSIGRTTPPGSDGKDLTALITRGSASRTTSFIEGTKGNHWNAVRTNRHKYVEFEDGALELYDLQVDPYELTNVAGAPAYANVTATLLVPPSRRCDREHACADTWDAPKRC